MRPRAAVKLYTARNVGLLPESPPADELDGDGSSVWFVHLLKRLVSLISEWTGLLWRDSFFSSSATCEDVTRQKVETEQS